MHDRGDAVYLAATSPQFLSDPTVKPRTTARVLEKMAVKGLTKPKDISARERDG